MTASPLIIYCHCAYAQVVPKATKEAVLRALLDSGVAFDAVADLCEMSARRDPALQQISAAGDAVKIAACYPRAVQWLFAAAGTPLSGDANAIIENMRVEPAEKVVFAILGPGFARQPEPVAVMEEAK